MEIEFFRTSVSSPILVSLTVVYFLSEAISTFDTRIIQAKKAGYLEQSYKVPDWTGVFAILSWIIFLAILLLNPIYAVIMFIVKFILKVLPILENIGAILLIPIVGKSAISAVNFAGREQRKAGREFKEMTEKWKNKD